MLKQWLDGKLSSLDERKLLRRERIFSHSTGSLRESGGKKFHNFADNNYLGMARHPELVRCAREAVDELGISTAASRLITGTCPVHRALERRIARFKGTEDAITFTSGYQANLSVIPAVAEKGDEIYADKLNHASLIDGVRLARCKAYRYEHNDTAHLEKYLKRRPDSGGKAIIVTDSVFSMDGDLAPLHELVRLKERYGAVLMIDEAHATGVMGRRGHGMCEALGIPPQSMDIIMGTFSKAIGTFGAYIAGSKELVAWLRTRARGYMYTTAYPPVLAAVTIKSLDLVEEGDFLRRRLWKNTEKIKGELGKAGFDLGGSESQILPILVGENEAALTFQSRLERKGIFVSAIRPPTVPAGTARLRLTVSSEHTDEALDYVVQNLVAVGRELGVVP